MDSQLNYDAIFSSFKWEFQHAIRTLNFNVHQAFGYLYDEKESVLRNPSIWIRIAAYTSLFKCASNYGVPLDHWDKQDPFVMDVKSEFLEIFASYDRLLVTEEIPTYFRNMQTDLLFIKEKYGSWAKV